ncbi:uncharacterized protein LOC120132954 [Hibiscus syriacus]|uniref:uncharacterized protein LOC120132954 n=1 Tax=Hibiscus syriacus TaxID=106335 RepID=UPI001924FF0B|nr:uncharacterized protein LOC120132954 [Hibiscus syriacus]
MPQARQFRGSGNFFTICDRCLQHPYLFCSLSCKRSYLLRTEDGLSKFLFECNYLPLNYSGLDTPDSVLEPSGSTKTSSGCGGYDEVWCGALTSTATTSEIVRKKRTSLTVCRRTCPPESEVPGSLMNRRKKTPQRAPPY